MAFRYSQLRPGVSSLPSHRICVEPESENQTAVKRRWIWTHPVYSFPLRYTTNKDSAFYNNFNERLENLSNGIFVDLLPYFPQLYAFQVLCTDTPNSCVLGSKVVVKASFEHTTMTPHSTIAPLLANKFQLIYAAFSHLSKTFVNLQPENWPL